MFTKHLCTRAGLAPSTGNVVSRAFLPRLIASSQLALVRHNSDWGRAPMRHEDRGVRQARCHNCGAVGHMSSSCPTRGTPKCYACGQDGHISRDCPSPRQQNPRFTQSRTCYKCGEDGHIARDCSSPSSGVSYTRKSSSTDMICYNCQGTGHLARDCQEESKCRTCHAVGHTSRECTEERVIKCYNCGAAGHMSRDCPTAESRSRY